MEDSQEIKDNLKTYKMTLLFTQTRHLHEIYNEEMTLSPETYYLVDKKWLDDYKKKNNYDKIVKKLKNNLGYNNYLAVKEKLLEELEIDNNDLTTIDSGNLIENFFSSEKQVLEKYQLKVPKNIELVLESFIKDCLNNSFQLGFVKTKVYIGNQTILIEDDEKTTNKVLYCCSLIPNERDDYDFFVKVEYILFFRNKDAQEKQIGEMIDLGGLKNYLTKLNIDINKKEEQEIRDKNGQIIGKFLKFQEKNNNDIFNQENSGINSDINNNSNNLNRFSNNSNNINQLSNNSNNINQFSNNSNQINQFSNNPNPINQFSNNPNKTNQSSINDKSNNSSEYDFLKNQMNEENVQNSLSPQKDENKDNPFAINNKKYSEPVLDYLHNTQLNQLNNQNNQVNLNKEEENKINPEPQQQNNNNDNKNEINIQGNINVLHINPNDNLNNINGNNQQKQDINSINLNEKKSLEMNAFSNIKIWK